MNGDFRRQATVRRSATEIASTSHSQRQFFPGDLLCVPKHTANVGKPELSESGRVTLELVLSSGLRESGYETNRRVILLTRNNRALSILNTELVANELIRHVPGVLRSDFRFDKFLGVQFALLLDNTCGNSRTRRQNLVKGSDQIHE